MSAATPIRARDELVTHLEQRISNGEFVPGTLLPSERALAEHYGLSRSMIREALRILGERRLIDVVPGRGSFVRETTAEDAVQRLSEIFDHGRVTLRYLIEARTMIETTAAALAAERGDEEELDRMRQALTLCNQADSLLERVRWDVAFHQGIVQAAQNPLVATMFQAIQPYIVELLLRSLTDSVVTKQGLAFHQRIHAAIAARDPMQARQLMQDHLTIGLTLFGRDIDRNLSLVAQESLKRLSSTSVSLQDLLSLSGGKSLQPLYHGSDGHEPGLT